MYVKGSQKLCGIIKVKLPKLETPCSSNDTCMFGSTIFFYVIRKALNDNLLH